MMHQSDPPSQEAEKDQVEDRNRPEPDEALAKAPTESELTLASLLQVVGGAFGMFSAWGIVVTFGTFQSYYEASPAFDATPSAIAWIGSIQAFLLLAGGGITGRLYDAGYLRHLLVAGTFLILFGLMMTSLANAFWQLVLAQGLCVGCGMGCVLVPCVAAASTWFNKYRGLAVGFVTSGTSVGGTVLPIMTQHLLPKVGFAWAVRILGFVVLGTLSISIAVMRTKLKPRRRGDFFEFKALKEKAFLLYVVGMFVAVLGWYVMLDFIQSWAEAKHVDTGSLDPIYLVPIINAASTPGRALPGILFDFWGSINVQILCGVVSAIFAYAWLGVDTLPPLLVVASLYGFFSGGFLAAPPAAVASLTDDMTRFGARMGLCFVFMASGSLAGGPVTGAIIGHRGPDGHYRGAMIWSGTTLLVGNVLLVVSRTVVHRKTGRRKI